MKINYLTNKRKQWNRSYDLKRKEMNDTVSKVKYDGRAKIPLSWADIDKYVTILSEKIKHLIDAKRIENIYGISRGGLIPAVMLSHKLNIPITTKLSSINSKTLIVDDIEDSSKTLKEFKTGWKVVIVSKQIERQSDYIGFYTDISDWIVFPWEKQ